MLPKGLLKEYSRIIEWLIRLTDILLLISAGCASYWFRFNQIISPLYAGAVFIGIVLIPIIFSSFGIYTPMRGRGFKFHIIQLVKAVFILAFLLAGFAFFTKLGESFSRIWFILWMTTALAAIILFRCTVMIFLRYMRRHGLNERRVVIIGASTLGIKLANTVQHALWTGFNIVLFMDDRAENQPASLHDIPIISTPTNLSDFLNKQKIDEIWFALPLSAELRVKEILHELRHDMMAKRFLLDIFAFDLLNYSISDLAGFPSINICSTPMLGINRLIKALEDRVLAFLILISISPLLILIAIAIKCTSAGPIFYKQKRVGWNGQEFEMLKFRTMPIDAEFTSGPIWATADDKRATVLGKFLRRTSLDELPQFINVIKGEMSIVGPRPERKIFVDQFKEKIPQYMQKHLVKAGITGWAQIHGWRGNTSLEKRVEYDLYYIEHWSLLLDLKIIFLTIFKGFINQNAY